MRQTCARTLDTARTRPGGTCTMPSSPSTGRTSPSSASGGRCMTSSRYTSSPCHPCGSHSAAQTPVFLLLTVTIPVVDLDRDNENWNRFLTIIQCACAPVFAVFATECMLLITQCDPLSLLQLPRCLSAVCTPCGWPPLLPVCWSPFWSGQRRATVCRPSTTGCVLC